jgi:hypothetical protein
MTRDLLIIDSEIQIMERGPNDVTYPPMTDLVCSIITEADWKAFVADWISQQADPLLYPTFADQEKAYAESLGWKMPTEQR